MEEKFQRKLQILMKNEGVSQSRLAEMLEVKPSTLSHILAGRNYPGFDMLQKLRRLFPHINADWLLLDSSEDYLANASAASAASTAPVASAASDLFSGVNASDDAATVAARGTLGSTPRSSATAAGGIAATAFGRGDAAASSAVSAQMLSSLDRADGVRIRRIIVLYEDNSFESFTPRP